MTAKPQKSGGVLPEKEINSAEAALTLRDRFAIAAMRGIVSTYSNGCGPKGGFGVIARAAYLLADAMLEVRAEAHRG